MVGVPAAEVVILGGGVSGTHAAAIALGMGANVTVVDRSAEALRRIATQFGSQVRTIFSTRDAIRQIVKRARLVQGLNRIFFIRVWPRRPLSNSYADPYPCRGSLPRDSR